MRRRRYNIVLLPILLSSWRHFEQQQRSAVLLVAGLSSPGWTKLSCSTRPPPGAAIFATTNHHEAAAAAAGEPPPLSAVAARQDDRRAVLRRAMMMLLSRPPPPLVVAMVGTTTQSCRCAMAAAVLPVNTDGIFTFDDENDNNDQAAANSSSSTTTTIRCVDITLSSPAESLGVEIGNDPDHGTVRIQRIIDPSRSRQQLREGMIVQDVKSAKDLFDRLRNGPYPVTVRFIMNDDENGPKRSTTLAETTTAPTTTSDFASFSIVTTFRPFQCDDQKVTRRGDVLELVYEAYYVVAAATKEEGGQSRQQEEIMYDASAWRGTGRPYQMVLGSGDMIPGVDQGLLNMCVGEQRILYIPKPLGHGPQSRRLFGIPDNDYLGLKWTVELVRVESSEQ